MNIVAQLILVAISCLFFSFANASLTPPKTFPTPNSQNKEAREFIKEVLGKKRAIEESRSQKEEKNVFLVFSDFDGTIIKGDITEGLESNKKTNEKGYMGLQELGISKGYSRFYHGQKGYRQYLEKYLETARYNELASCFLIMFPFIEMSKEEKKRFKELINKTFLEELSKYIFQESNIIINELQRENIFVHIVSASPQFFVRGAAVLSDKNLFDIPKERISGMTLDEQGHTYGEGKWKEILTIKKEYEAKGYTVHILGGMGNSYRTDGPFLKHITEQGGKALMINGGKAPSEYASSKFITTEF